MRQHYRLLLVTLGILLLTIPGLSACYAQTAPTTPATPAGGNTTPPQQPTPSPEPIFLPPPDGKVLTVVRVDLSGFAFSPATVTITGTGGALVIWTNQDSVTHIVRSDDDLFDSGNLSQGETYAHEFHQKGTFLYHCRIHPTMTGKVVVE